MRPHLVLAATLAAFFVVGCSSEKSTSPKVPPLTGPMEKPSVKPSHEAASAPPPKGDPPPAAATASPPAQNQDPAKDTDTDKPPAPPDPLAGIAVERRTYYEQFADLLVPVGKAGRAAVQAAFQPQFSEHEKRLIVAVQLGEDSFSLKREGETTLRTLLADAKGTEIESHRYLAAVHSLLGGPEKAHMLATAYEYAIDEGADIPADTRKKLVKLIRPEEPQEAFARALRERLRDAGGSISEEAEYLRTKLLEQSVQANDLVKLTDLIHNLGQSVIEERERCRTFHDLLMALPEPHRSDVLTQLAWSPTQEEALDREREKLKQVKPSRLSPKDLMTDNQRQYEAEYTRELKAIVADQREGFLAIEQARRDTIEGCFLNVDASGRQALGDLNERFTQVEVILRDTLSKLGYQLQPLMPADAVRDAASNVLAKIPLRGSVEDRVPTLRISDFQIIFDAPAGDLSYANLLKQGNVFVGTLRLEEEPEHGHNRVTTYHAELHIGVMDEEQMVHGELVAEASAGRQVSIPFKGAVGPDGFAFEARKVVRGVLVDFGTLIGSLDKGGPLTGRVRGNPWPMGSFSFTLKK